MSSILNEPIPGQGVFWSSVGGKPYPVAFRALSFEGMYKPLDKDGKAAAVETFAKKLREMFPALTPSPVMVETGGLEPAAPAGPGVAGDGLPSGEPQAELIAVGNVDGHEEEGQAEAAPADHLAALREKAVTAFKASKWHGKADGEGAAWGSLKALCLEVLPVGMDSHERDSMAYELVPHVMTKVFGPQNTGWHSFKAASKVSGTLVLYVKKGPKPGNS